MDYPEFCIRQASDHFTWLHQLLPCTGHIDRSNEAFPKKRLKIPNLGAKDSYFQ